MSNGDDARIPGVGHLLQAALNGDREHIAAPRTPEELAVEARAAVDAGATSLHLHPYDEYGCETLAAKPCAQALRAVRFACPGIPISLSTSAAIEPEPGRRYALIAAWTELPDLVTANMGEEGILELCELLLERGIGIEAGLLSLADANAFVALGVAPQCVRALVEPLDSDPHEAAAHAETIEQALDEGGICLEQIHHGDGIASWAVNRRAVARGHGIRTGLEDTPVLPDGRAASGNGELVAAAASLVHGHRIEKYMPDVVQTARIPMSVDVLWHEIGGFGAVGDWHPMLEKVDSEGDTAGATRSAHAADGSTQVERLQVFDANRRVYRYTMESTVLPVDDYVGEFRIDDNGNGTSTVTWSAQFNVSKDADDEVLELVGSFLKAGIDNLKYRYGEVE